MNKNNIDLENIVNQYFHYNFIISICIYTNIVFGDYIYYKMKSLQYIVADITP